MTDTKRKALGRGLETLLPSRTAMQPPPPEPAPAPAPAPQQPVAEPVREIPIGLIDKNPYQTRMSMDAYALEELAKSIKECGLLQPITVRAAADGRFEIVAGERRWVAMQALGKASVPAIVRQMSNRQALEMTIIENLQREGLNPIEEARGFERLAREFNMTQEQIAERTGKPRSTVANFMRLLNLPPAMQGMIANAELSMGHVKALMSVPSPALLRDFAERTVKHSWTVRELEKEIAVYTGPRWRQGGEEDEGGTVPEKPRPPEDPNVREAENRLRAALGLRVTVRDRHGKGKVVIEYTNLDEFDQLLEVLAK